MTINLAIAVGVGLFVLALVLYAVMIFNDFVRLRFNIDKAWANVDVLLKQRHDEVPNLVAVVSGIKDFEKNVMQQVAAARSASQQAPDLAAKSQAEKDLAGSLNRFFAVAENYPQLKAQENFLSLQKTLAELEDEIADRRALYNDTVAIYNSRVAEFPDRLLASPFGFTARLLFQAGEGEKGPVPVELSKA